MQKTLTKSNKSLNKNPKYSAPKPGCEGCKKSVQDKNKTMKQNGQNYTLLVPDRH